MEAKLKGSRRELPLEGRNAPREGHGGETRTKIHSAAPLKKLPKPIGGLYVAGGITPPKGVNGMMMGACLGVSG